MNSPAHIKLSGIEQARCGADLPVHRSTAGRTDGMDASNSSELGGAMLGVTGPANGLARPAESQRFFYRWGRLLSSTLIKLRSRFDGDFDQYLIYMVFVLSDLSRKSPYSSYNQNDSNNSRREVGLNTLSIADITEIPRETARRKLRLLVQAGYLKRGVNQLYYLGERYDTDEFVGDLIPLFNTASAS